MSIQGREFSDGKGYIIYKKQFIFVQENSFQKTPNLF
jgi:hypothetical protein